MYWLFISILKRPMRRAKRLIYPTNRNRTLVQRAERDGGLAGGSVFANQIKVINTRAAKPQLII